MVNLDNLITSYDVCTCPKCQQKMSFKDARFNEAVGANKVTTVMTLKCKCNYVNEAKTLSQKITTLGEKREAFKTFIAKVNAM